MIETEREISEEGNYEGNERQRMGEELHRLVRWTDKEEV